MRAIVLAAGEGSRLRPLTVHKPKPMVRAANKPIVQHVVEALVQNGVRDITLVVGHHRSKVQSHFGDGGRFGCKVTYAFQEALTGTTQGLATAPRPEGPFLLLSGDNVVDVSLIKRALAEAPGPAMVVHKSERPSKYGVVHLEGERVERVIEKPADPRSEWVNTGVYVLPPEYHDRARKATADGVLGFTDVLDAAIREGARVTAVRSDDLWADAVYPWDLLRVHAELLRRSPHPVPRSVPAHAFVEPPVLVGQNVTLGPGVVLGAGTVIGNNVHIRAHSVIESCIVYDDVQIGPYACMQNTILGEGTRVGPRFTALSGPCHLRAAQEWHDLDDFGAVVGEDALLEGSVTLMPGVMVGNRARVEHGRTLARAIEDGAHAV
jgi:glucose-1-phosphate thymidylyltransferase